MKTGTSRPRSQIIGRTDAEATLSPLIPLFRTHFQEAWYWVQNILNDDADRRRTLDPATVCNMVYDRFIKQILPELETEGVEIERTGRMVRFRVDQIVLRFKRLDKKLRSRNIPTLNQHRIYHQMDLFDIDDAATAVTFGYVLDNSRLTVRGVYFVCPKNYTENLWMIPIFDESAGDSLSFVKPTPVFPMSPAATATDSSLPTMTPKVKPSKVDGL